MSISCPGFRIILADGGKDITRNFASRLISLTLTDEREAESDRVEITLDDADGLLDVPAEGVEFQLHLGWLILDGKQSELLDKGKFKVDEAAASGPPDVITITARAADFTGKFKTRKMKAHKATTLGTIARQIATAAGLKPHIHASANGIVAALEAQQGQSDMALLTALGLKHDLAVTTKNGRLIIAPIGKGETASGKALPAATIERSATDTFRYARAKRETHDGVEAQWHDRKSATVKTVKVGASGKGEPRKLKRTHPSEAAAKAHATSTHNREQRAAATLEIGLALGRPELAVEQPITLKGWKKVIDDGKWLIKSASHTLDGGGLKTSLSLEVKV